MDKILEQIEDLSKRLSRPIKDLDDIRIAMGALKELRENEIFIDMSLNPIEVIYYVYSNFINTIHNKYKIGVISMVSLLIDHLCY